MTAYEIDGFVPVVHLTAFVHETASLIGDVIVEAGCYIGPFASLRGDFGRVFVGEGSNVQDNCVIHAFPGADAHLERNSHIGHAAVLHGCRVGSYAMVGIGAVVLDGAVIGEDALVGAQSLVTAGTVIGARKLAHGSPATEVRELDDDMIAWKRRGVGLYQDLARRSRQSLRPVTARVEVEPGRGRLFAENPPTAPLHVLRREGGFPDPAKG